MKPSDFRKTTVSVAFVFLACVLILSFNNCNRGWDPSGGEIDPSRKGVETGNPMTSLAVLPKIYLNSDYPKLPASHKILTVGAANRDYKDCQSAVNAARPGDEVVIDARFICSRLILPDKGPSENYIVIRSANLSELPSEGTRISKVDAANMPIIESINDEFAIGIADLPSGSNATSGANHYYLLGLEIRVNPKVNVLNAYIVKLRNGGKNLAQLPHDITISRSWIHGNPNQEINRGIDLNGLRISIVDSIIEDVHRHGSSSQGIAAWDASVGPYKITNNEIAVAGAALLIGWESTIPNLISSDIEVRKNLFHKMDAWRKPVTSTTGVTDYWNMSETIILRSVQRILFDGNTFENDWGHVAGGPNYMGRAFYLSPSGFGQSWARVQDVTIVNNVMHDIPGGFLISYQDKTMPEVITQRIHIENNVAFNLDPSNNAGFIRLQGRAAGSVVFNHNTFLAPASGTPTTIVGAKDGIFGHFAFTNNIIHDQGAGVLGLGSAAAGGQSLSTQFPDVVFHHNVLAGQSLENYQGYSDLNDFPANLSAIGFVLDPSLDLFDLQAFRLVPSSPYAGTAADGTDVGANIRRIVEAQK